MSVEEHAHSIFEVPLMKAIGARFAGFHAGLARVALSVDQRSLNANAVVHGGVLYALLDMAAYLAVVPSLKPGQTAVTHNINASVFGALALGAELLFEGRIVHMGRTLAVVASTARAADRQIATATVCKSIIVLR